MKREQFKTWLVGRGLATSAVASRISGLGRIERVMHDLGDPSPDLDAAFDADRFGRLREGLTNLIQDRKAGGQAYRTLLPDSLNPDNRLMSHRAWLGQYAAFRRGEGTTSATSGWPELESMRAEFLRRAPDFADFLQRDGTYFDGERGYKDAIIAEVQRLVAAGLPDDELGGRAFEALKPQRGPIVRWQVRDAVERTGAEPFRQFRATLGRLARDDGDVVAAIAAAADRFQALRAGGVEALTKGEILNIAFSLAGCARPDRSAPFKIDKARTLATRLGVAPMSSAPITRDEVAAWLSLLQRIFVVMRDDWRWRPRDLFDVQGFAWMVLDKGWDAPPEDDTDNQPIRSGDEAPPMPLNTILFGPPGTGKTFATMREAVAICDGRARAGALDEAALRARHDALRDAGRIAFVTFHQSYAYEDFVEGLRPETETQDGAGFRLVPRPGLLRQMADLAARGRSAPPSGEAAPLDGRGIFKMSLGRANNDEDAYIYEECLEGGHVLLGYGGSIDWSPERFSQWSAILAEWKTIDPAATGYNPNVTSIWSFRNDMKVGDLVIVSNGNHKFRAIGEVTGDYELVERATEDEYRHRRKVRWLWNDPDGLPASALIDGQFSMRSVYRVPNRRVKAEALAAYLAPPQAAEHLPHVLVIDEINRANVSKVFGELITLLEEDKRAGAANAVTVRLPTSGEAFSLPANLHILGTMNTADRSIALLDTALRRRFSFVEMPPRPDLLGVVDGLDLALLLTRLNERIEWLFDRDHLIGHAFLMGSSTRADVDEVMRRKVIPLLAEYFHEDWGRIVAVLGGPAQGFIERTRLSPPPGVDAEGEDRFRFRVRDPFPEDAYAGLQA